MLVTWALRLPMVRLALVLGPTVGILLGPATPAFAKEPGDERALSVTVQADDPLHPVVVLTNRGSASCRVATVADGTIALTTVEQNGVPIAPEVSAMNYLVPLDAVIEGSLRDLAPGESVRLAVLTAAGPRQPSLWMSSWAAETGAIGAVFPVTDAPLRLAVTYALPIAAEGACPAAVGDSRDAAGATASHRLWYGVAVVGAVLVVGALVAVLVLRRRRRGGPRRGVTVAALVIAVGLVAGVFVAPRPAAAEVHAVGDDDFKHWFDQCWALFNQPGNDPAGILPVLTQYQQVHVEVSFGTSESLNRSNDLGGGLIHWDPTARGPMFHDGVDGVDEVDHSPCTDLYHELFHSYEAITRVDDPQDCWVTRDGREVNTGIPIDEVNATRAENQLRARRGGPLRRKYGPGLPLPSEQCHHAPPPPPPHVCATTTQRAPAPAALIDVAAGPLPSGRTAGALEWRAAVACRSGDVFGEPHLVTVDGARYEFQAVGEFVAARDPSGGFAAQVRLRPTASSNGLVSILTAVAFDVAGDRVQVEAVPGEPALWVNGTATPLPLQPLTLPGGGQVSVERSAVTVTWADGSVAVVPWYSRGYLGLSLSPADIHSGHLAGLLGDADSDAGNDVRSAGGQPVSLPPSYDALYPSFADSWRVGPASLFRYQAGESTETFTDRSYPRRAVTVDELPNRDWAQQVCAYLGVVAKEDLATCVYDLAVTGDVGFAIPSLDVQSASTGLRIDGAPTAVTPAAGGVARVEFVAQAGQRVYVDVQAPTVPPRCGVLSLVSDDDTKLATGCLVEGHGRIDATLLPTAGRYAVLVGPDVGGPVTVRVITAEDTDATIVPNGPEVLATVATAGGTASFSFTGTAGQAVFVEARDATLPVACGVLILIGPDGNAVNTGCVIEKAGYINRTDLPSSGTYRVVVDPPDDGTGTLRLRLYALTDQLGTIEVGGPSVTARIDQPGAAARFTFTGVAGQRVFLDITDATLPTECGFTYLLDAAGTHVVDGCILAGTGYLDQKGTVLPTSGQYTIVVDSRGADTGVATLRLRT